MLNDRLDWTWMDDASTAVVHNTNTQNMNKLVQRQALIIIWWKSNRHSLSGVACFGLLTFSRWFQSGWLDRDSTRSSRCWTYRCCHHSDRWGDSNDSSVNRSFEYSLRSPHQRHWMSRSDPDEQCYAMGNRWPTKWSCWFPVNADIHLQWEPEVVPPHRERSTSEWTTTMDSDRDCRRVENPVVHN